eukprot:4784084-Pyramimonas_sp.AAC.1
MIVRHSRATSVVIPGAVYGNALAQRLTLRQRGGQARRARQGEPRAAHDVRPRALPRELLFAGPEHEQAPRPHLGFAVVVSAFG